MHANIEGKVTLTLLKSSSDPWSLSAAWDQSHSPKCRLCLWAKGSWDCK